MLIYLLLADRRVEIVADRGIHARVGDTAWETICGAMQREFAAGRYERGMHRGLSSVSDLLAQHFPARRSGNANELPDAPEVAELTPIDDIRRELSALKRTAAGRRGLGCSASSACRASQGVHPHEVLEPPLVLLL